MPKSRWEIWNINPTTKRRIKAYAAMHNVDIAEAITRLVKLLEVNRFQQLKSIIQGSNKPIFREVKIKRKNP